MARAQFDGVLLLHPLVDKGGDKAPFPFCRFPGRQSLGRPCEHEPVLWVPCVEASGTPAARNDEHPQLQ